MRVLIISGKLVDEWTVRDENRDQILDKSGQPFGVNVVRQVFDEAGRPATADYQGVAHISDKGGERLSLLIGDPYADAQLIEGSFSREITTDSKSYFEGFEFALREKSKAKTLTALAKKGGDPECAVWLDGWREGWSARKERGLSPKLF